MKQKTLFSFLLPHESYVVNDGSGGYLWTNPKLDFYLNGSEEEILHRFNQIQSPHDLSNFLEVPYGQMIYIVYRRQYEFNYKEFFIPKKSGELRKIESPQKGLRSFQYKLLPVLRSLYRVKKPVHGFVSNGKGIFSNANQHKKKNYLLNVDLKDFFHSIHFGRVRGIFLAKPFNLREDVASILAAICTTKSGLPQGAPTSPILSNLVASRLDRDLVGVAKKYHLAYSRYADDLTFSSNKKISQDVVVREISDGDEIIEVGKILKRVIEDNGFEINERKVRLQHSSQRQEVTGLVVNQVVNVNRKFIRNTRAMINSWKVHGLAEAERIYLNEKGTPVQDAGDGYRFKSALYGRLNFIRYIRGEEFSSYLALCRKVLEIDPEPPKFVRKLKDVFNMYDVFICHASEDKENVAIPLHSELDKLGIKSFVDCFEINWGDSLVTKINTALQKARYVVAIISDKSIDKAWPKKEIAAVLSQEISSSETKLLPLMVGDSVSLIAKLPLLADKLFKEYSDNPQEIAGAVRDLVNSN